MIAPAPHRLVEIWVAALRRLAAVSVLFLAVILVAGPAHAVKPIVVGPDQDRIEVTSLGELDGGRGDSLQIETAAGADGMVGRMSVSAVTPGTNPNWMVFALTNPTDKPIERWLTADRYNLVGSGAVWPDLDARRIEAVTPSVGFVPERVKSDRADIFRITLEPGQTITYVAELSSERVVRIFLWKPLDYEQKSSNRQLFNGIMLGLTGLMAIFLTSIFAANHKLVFPASALVAWVALAYLCVDFGFFHKLFNLKPEANAVYRAAAEASLAASLVVFLHIYLRLALSHGLIRMLIGVWVLFQVSLIAVAILDPRLAATFARLSFVAIGVIGAGLIGYLAMRGQDRALSLIPPWILFLVWIFGVAVTLSGRLYGDVVVAGLVGGMVLILLIITFTVTQFAFRPVEPLFGAAPSELQLRSVAIDGAGAVTWEWNARRDEIKVGPMVEAALGLHPGELCRRVEEFARHVHPADRERFRLALWSVQERSDGKLRSEFRLRQADNEYRWFELEAAGVPGTDPRSFKCIGLLRDVTDLKRAHERLLQDAVNDSLTGLPNRALLLDRLAVGFARAKTERQVRPAIIAINIDKFRTLNASVGSLLGDSLLLTVARRLQRHLGPGDTLARIGGDEFALLVTGERPIQDIAGEAERMRRSLRSPIKIGGQEIVLTASLGTASYDGSEQSHEDILRNAEIAMYRAKRAGADRLEVYRPEMRTDRDETNAVEGELRKALERNQIKLFYQPLIYLPTEQLAGFETLVRWDHPQLGPVDPLSAVSLNDDSDLVVKLGSHVLMRAARDAGQWQKELPRNEHQLFVSVNVASRQLFRQDLIQEIRHILGRNLVPRGSLRIEVSERLVMENPEQATEILELLRGAGADLAMDDFGGGYCSLGFLDRLPVDTVKIDRSLLAQGAAAPLVRALVALAHELGRKVVAVGVETADDVSALRSLGCEYAQGPFYSDPVPQSEISQLLAIVRKTESKPRGVFRDKGVRRRGGGAAPEADVAASGTAPAQAPVNGAAPIGAEAPRPAAAKPAPPAAAPPAGAPPGAAAAATTGRPRLRPAAARAANGNGAVPSAPTGQPAGSPIAQPAPNPLIAGNGVAHPGGEKRAPAARRDPLPPGVVPLPVAGNGAQPQGQPTPRPQPQTPAQAQPMPQPHGMPARGPLPPPAPPTARERTGPPAMPPPLPSAPLPAAPQAARPPGPPPLPQAPAPRPVANNGPVPLQPQPVPPAPAPAALDPRAPAQGVNGGQPYPQPRPVPQPSPAAPQTNGSGQQNSGHQPEQQQPIPDFSQLPPAIAESLARLAGVTQESRKKYESGGG